MLLNIFIFILSLGISMRGLIYYFVSKMSINSKYKQLSFSKSENVLEYTEENEFASKAYITIGLIYSLFTLILLITFNDFLNKYWIAYICMTFLIDLFINMLTHIKIGLNKYDKTQKKEEE